MTKPFIRAKSDKNKQIKMNEIMKVTNELFQSNPYHEITLSTIAKQLNIARSGLYKYVNTKEEIMLAIYLQKQKAAVTDILSKVNNNTSQDEFATIFSKTIYQHLDYIKYHQILNAIIETNVTVKRLASFKTDSYNMCLPLYEIIKDIYHLESVETSFDKYLTIIYHCLYLRDRVAYSSNYVQAMKVANLPINDIDFIKELSSFITTNLLDKAV